MAEIYRGAKHVLVYPGPSPRALNLASKLAHDSIDNPGSRLWKAWNALILQLFGATVERTALLPYWNRSWIVQELLGARNCFVVSNSGLIDWRSFRSLYDSFGLGTHQRLGRGAVQVSLFCDRGEGAMQYHSRNALFVRLVKHFFYPPVERYACTDRRDYIYSLLGLAADGQGFQVDYRKTPVSLFLDTIQHFRVKIPHVFCLDALILGLQVKLSCYCGRCSDRILPKNKRTWAGLGKDYRCALLVVEDWSSAKKTWQRTSAWLGLPQKCATCSAADLFEDPYGLAQRKQAQIQFLVRAAEDKMFCYTHKLGHAPESEEEIYDGDVRFLGDISRTMGPTPTIRVSKKIGPTLFP
jgi:hypothetical protein